MRVRISKIIGWGNFFVKNPIFLILFVKNFFSKEFNIKAKIISTEELINNYLESGKSIVRLGDGDMGVMHGKEIFHQSVDRNLSEDLYKIVKEYTFESPYILSIPKFVNYTNAELRKNGNFACWYPFKVEFVRFFNRDLSYADAHLFYFKEITEVVMKKFVIGKKVIFISNEEIIEKIKSTDLTSSESSFYITPSSGAYNFKNKILSDLEELITPEDVLVVSCGCLSRIIVAHFSKRGNQSFDIGTGIASYINNEDYSHLI